MADPLLQRIEKLEKQNKRMRAAVSALCLCLAALLTMGYMLPQKTGGKAERIEAREIVLRDGTKSATLTPGSLVFSDKSGFEPEKAAFAASGVMMGGRYAMEVKPTGLTCTRDGVQRFDLNVGEIGAALAFKNDSGHMGTMLDEATLVLINESGIVSMRPTHILLQKGEADAFLAAGSVRLRDADKFKAILGRLDQAASKIGEARSKSAASLVLLGQDDTVVWQAP